MVAFIKENGLEEHIWPWMTLWMTLPSVFANVVRRLAVHN